MLSAGDGLLVRVGMACCLLAAAACDGGSTPPSPDTRITFASVAASGHMSCGLTSTGLVYCWGDLSIGAYPGTVTSTPAPIDSLGARRYTAVTVGGSHACALTTSGEAYCWGDNTAGKLGDGTYANTSVPVAVAGGHTFAALAAGSAHSCGLTTTGAVYCWGAYPGDGVPGFHHNRTPVQVVGGRTFTSLSAGSIHSCAVTTTNEVYCWGGNQSGQLGNGTMSYAEATTPSRVLTGVPFARVAAGQSHSCALTLEGAAWCWGNNTFGRLGVSLPASTPVPVVVATAQRFAHIDAGEQHTCAIVLGNDRAYCWGFNLQGQSGTSITGSAVLTPTAVMGDRAMSIIALGHNHTCGVMPDGSAYCWGFNDFGQIGDGTTRERRQPTPVLRP